MNKKFKGLIVALLVSLLSLQNLTIAGISVLGSEKAFANAQRAQTSKRNLVKAEIKQQAKKQSIKNLLSQDGFSIKNLSPETASSISSGSTVSGSFNDYYVENWHKIQLAGSSKVDLNLSFPATVDGMLIIYSQDLEPMQIIDNGFEGETEEGTAYLEAAGTYYILAIAFQEFKVNATYSLTATYNAVQLVKDQFEPNDSKDFAKEITEGSTISASLMPTADIDVYKLNITEAKALEIALTVPATIDGSLLIFDQTMSHEFEDGEALDMSDRGGQGVKESLVYNFKTPGTYYIVVKDWLGTPSDQPYTLEVKEPTLGHSAYTAFVLDNGESITNTLEDGGSQHWYKVSLPSDSRLKVNLTSVSAIDGGMELYSEDLRSLSIVDDGFDGEPESLDVYVEGSKTYYIQVYNANSDEGGNYTISTTYSPAAINKDKFEPNNNRDSATSLSFGTKVTGTIMPLGDIDVFKLNVTAPGVLKANLNVPSAIDAALILFDAKMEDPSDEFESLELADSGWEGESEELTFSVVKPGTYYLVVKDYLGNTSNETYSLTVNLTPFKSSMDFSDVKADYWAATQIGYLVNNGVINGYNDGTFKPANKVTRAQAVVMIVNALMYKDIEGPVFQNVDVNFTDINEDYWAYPYIEIAVQLGIVNGYSDGSFKPSNYVTRAQMAVMLAKAFVLKEKSNLSFQDVKSDYWAHDYINKVATAGITSGYSDGTFKPGNFTTRAQMAVFLARAMEPSFRQ